MVRFTLTADYYENMFGGSATLGFGRPGDNYTLGSSFWTTVAKSWADPRMGLFLSRHRPNSTNTESPMRNLYYGDSEVMFGYVELPCCNPRLGRTT